MLDKRTHKQTNEFAAHELLRAAAARNRLHIAREGPCLRFEVFPLNQEYDSGQNTEEGVRTDE
jgi:hypothetical protein